ncbi:hypothetical protein EBN03_31400 [Nocardia stercoris]|uniref:Uncharacterized protein n=1 Tax=Nocardia stercoris TaxID=2483361 RepID=A0A3M2KSZ2_9NOCA|nr:hypothetical protein EBN03_31400 [Nocardia stercoris]
MLVVAALTIAVVALALIVPHNGSVGTATTAPSTTSLGPVSAPLSGTTAGTPGTPGATSAPAAPHFGYQPLWPFTSVTQARAWQQEANPGGHQPWHLDAGLVTQMFTQQYLGYPNVDKILRTDVRGDQSWVSVGFDNGEGSTTTAAVVHLVRIGAGADRPWEVVGTEDTTLSLTTPGYGSAMTSPLTAGGTVTGVDESLRVQVRGGPSPQQPVGEVSGIPAGGTNAPWSVTIPLHPICPGTFTVAVSTGGHVARVEHFAVTGVHC